MFSDRNGRVERPRPSLGGAILVSLLSLLTWACAPGVAQSVETWTPIGPAGASVFSLIRDPFTPGRWDAGMYFGGLYRSDDDAASWRQMPSPFSTFTLFCVAADPFQPGRLLVGTLSHGIYLSLDAGQTWQPSLGLTNLNVVDIAFDPRQSNSVLAATFQGVFHSGDGGATWRLSNGAVQNLPARTILFPPNRPGEVFVGTSGLGVFHSSDGGATWQSFTNGLGPALVNRLDEDNETGDLYASCDPGVYRLSAGSNSWEDLSFNLKATIVNQTLGATTAAGILAATDDGIFRLPTSESTNWSSWSDVQARLLLPAAAPGSYLAAVQLGTLMITTNDGASFEPADHGIQNRFVGALATVDAATQTVLYAGADFGVEFTPESFRSNAPSAWTTAQKFPGAVFALAASSRDSNAVYAAVERDGVWKGVNGTHWTRVSNGMVPQLVTGLSQSSAGSRTLYASTTEGLFVSTNDGASWFPDLTTATPQPATAVAADPVRPGVVFSATSAGNVYRSYDDGATFQSAWQAPAGVQLDQFSIAPYFNIYGVGSSRVLYVSTDDGNNFFPATQITNAVLSVAADPVRPWIAYAGTLFGGVYRTTNNAIDWQQSSQGLSVPIVYALAVDPTSDNLVYAGTQDNVYRSANGGVTWTETGPGLPSGAVARLEIDPNAPATIYASVSGAGIYRTTNSGASWSLLVTGDAYNWGAPVLVSRMDSQTLLAGTRLLGVTRSPDEGATWTNSSDGMTLFLRALAVDPNASQTLYAGSLLEGVFRTTNGGANWSPLGVADRAIYGVAVNPVNSSNILLATSSGVVASQDGGQTWFDKGQQSAYVFSVLINPANPLQEFISGAGGDFYSSQDGGQSWAQAKEGLPQANLVAAAADWAAHRLYVAAERAGVFWSADGGASWIGTNEPVLGSATVLQLSVVPGSGVVLAGTSQQGVFVSTNHGSSWSPQGLQDRDQVNDFAFDPGHGLIYAATSTGVARSSDSGRTWTAIGQRAPYVLQMISDPRNRSTLYVGTVAGQLYKSVDAGQEWNPANGGLPALSIFALAIDPGSGVLYCSPERDGVFRSADGGATWQQTDTSVIGGAKITSLAVEPVNGNVYAASDGNGLFVSRDGGATWATAGLTNDTQVYAVAFDPLHPGRIYAGSTSGMLQSSDDGQTWLERGQRTGTVFQLVSDPVDHSILYAGGRAGQIYKSGDAGMDWTSVSAGLPAQDILALAAGSDPGALYACPERQGLYQSTNGGGIWTRIDTQGLTNVQVGDLVVAPGGSRLFAATSGSGLLRSLDGGRIWAPASSGLESLLVTSVALDPFDTNRVYAATVDETGAQGGISVSVDGGLDWSPITNGIGSVAAFQVLPSPYVSNRVYTVTAASLFRSDDAGLTWSPSGAGLLSNTVQVLAFDGANPDWLYAATTNGLFRSTNGGAMWTVAASDFNATAVTSFAPGPVAGSMFAGSLNNGVFQTTNAGLSWTGGVDPALAGGTLLSLEADGYASNTLYAASPAGGVVKSVDGGATWFRPGSGLDSSHVQVVLVDPAQTNRIYAGTSDNGLYVSQDGGTNWTRPQCEFPALNVAYLEPGPAPGSLYAGTLGNGVLESVDGGQSLAGGVLPELVNPVMLAVDCVPQLPATLYAAIDPAGIIKSVNGGLTWRYANGGLLNVRVRRILVDPTDSNRVLAATFGAGMYLSTNAGAGWVQASADVGTWDPSSLASAGTGVFRAGTLGNGLLTSTDGGWSWTGGIAGSLVKPIVLGLAMNPQNPAQIYAATAGQGVLFSPDGGVHWSAANAGLGDSLLFAVAVDPVDPRVVYAGTSSAGVYVSENAGASWTPLTNGLFNLVVTSLALDVNDHRTLYAGTEGGGVFRLLRPLAPPLLRMSRSGPNLALTWTEPPSVYVLQQSPSLNPPQWSPVGVAPIYAQGLNTVTIPNPPDRTFYRLQSSPAGPSSTTAARSQRARP